MNLIHLELFFSPLFPISEYLILIYVVHSDLIDNCVCDFEVFI